MTHDLSASDPVVHRFQRRGRSLGRPRQAPRRAWASILRCSDGSFYVGSTHNLEQRLAQHAAGAVEAYTKTRRPVELVWAYESERIDDAWAVEGRVKGWRRAKCLALIEGRLTDLPELSRSHGRQPPG